MDTTNITDDYGNISLCNCIDNESNFDIVIPILFFTIPCGLSFLCLISITANTLIKHFK